MASKPKFRHQDFTEPPKGWRVRTVHAGKHEVRVAFPPGPRKKGSGKLVSILHPGTEKNPSCGLQLVSADVAKMDIPFDSLEAFALELEPMIYSAGVQNPTDWKKKWEGFKTEVKSLFTKRSESEPDAKPSGSEPKPNASKQKFLKHAKEVSRSAGGFLGFGGRSKDYWEVQIEKRTYLVPKGKGKGIKKIPVSPFKIDSATGVVTNPLKPEFRAEAKLVKKNLDEISKAVKLTEQFKGSPTKEVLEINEPARVRDDYAHLGWLLQLVFQPPYDRTELDLKKVSEVYEEMMNDGADPNKSWQDLSEDCGVPLLVFDFTGDEIRLAASADGKQLYLIGGRQDLFRNQLKAFKSDPEHDRVDLGEIISITYEAKKAQAGDEQPHPYYHIFGEEGGEAPRAFYDTLNNRIAIVGGSYHLKDADLGIVN